MANESNLEKLISNLSTPVLVDTSTLTKAVFSSDSSLYRIVPAGVGFPKTIAELEQLVAAALAAKVPITSRGAGTSCAGNAVGAGLVINTVKHLNQIIAIDPEAKTARVAPGVIQQKLQLAAAPFGLRFGPDPSTSNRCTIGGMIGNNACGPRALGHGRSSDNIVSLNVITGTGERLVLGAGQDESNPILASLKQLVNENLGVIRTEFGHFSRQVSGYSLEHLLPENGFNTAGFFAGTEGTLGVITEATVRLVEDPPESVMIAVGYPTMADAADQMPTILKYHPTACEGLDSRIVDVVIKKRGANAVPKLPEGKGWLMIELVGYDRDEVLDRANQLASNAGGLEADVVTDKAKAARLWKIRADGAGLAGVSLADPAYPGWEDAAVPPNRLGDYLRAFDDLLARHHMHGLPYGHFGDGCVHCRIDFPLDSAGGRSKYRDFMVEAADLVASFGGSLSGEHGDGRARSEFLPKMYSPQAIDLFRQVKRIFDPENLLNPGVLVSPAPTDQQVRYDQLIDAPLRIKHPDFSRAVHQCTGVGKCLASSSGAGEIMCPSYQATGDEKDSTRGRARVLQEMMNGSLVTKGWKSKEVSEALEYCLACKGCRRDCPTGIDMAAYRSRVFYEKLKHRLRPRSHYSMGWLPRWGRLVTAIPGLSQLANLFTQTYGAKHVVRWLAGVDQRRPMPKFRSGGRQARSKKVKQLLTEPISGQPVLIWVDSFSDAFEGDALPAMIKVLVDAGFAPQVLTETACCGLTWITTGQLDGARRQLANALEVLYPYAESGIPIVGMEPSCTAVWHSDAEELLADPRVEVVKSQVHTLAQLLAKSDRFKAPDLSDHTVVVQPHCHQASVFGFAADKQVLAATNANVVVLGGCCGLAGNFGVEKGHYELSVKVANNELLPSLEKYPDAIFLSDGFSCRKQVSDLTDRPVMTLAQLLAAHPVS